MISSSKVVAGAHRASLSAWFLAVGFVDIAVAGIAAYILHSPPAILLILLPTLALFGVDPSTPQGLLLPSQCVILFGGSFAIWGMIGLMVGALTRLCHSLPN